MAKRRKNRKYNTTLGIPRIFFPIVVLSILYLVFFVVINKQNNLFFSDVNSLKYKVPVEKGIDISFAQGDINWEKVKKAGIEFAIIRTGYGFNNPIEQIDTYYYTNINKAKENGIKVGVYHYSHATNEEEAIAEAKFVLNLLDGTNLEYPVYLDLETYRQDDLTVAQLTDLAVAFLEVIEEAGYTGGIYANKNWLTNKLNMDKLESYEVWIAFYSDTNEYDGEYGMWQFTDEGSVDGINGNVDLNIAYKYYN